MTYDGHIVCRKHESTDRSVQRTFSRAMAPSVTNLAVFGSTGSIGRSTLDVVRAADGRLNIAAISAHRNLELALEQARQFRPRWLIATNKEASSAFDWSNLPRETELLEGEPPLSHIAQSPEIDTVVAAIVGSAGLRSTLAAVEAGKTVALANKEALVAAGPLVMRTARERSAAILPIDSEHSALFQSLQAGKLDQVSRVLLTASGGPFLRHSIRDLEKVTVDEALNHPTWSMGRKITVDSATMMNKALEIVEARWLFGLSAEQIGVVVHPQSIVHSMVEYVDGSVVAQMSPPDMKLPIQYALTYPDRRPSPAAKLDWRESLHLDFEPPDHERFPSLRLGLEVAGAGGTAGAVLNAANEAAVAAFLREELKFTQIVPACRAVVENHHFEPSPTLDQLFELDGWARKEIHRWI
jgi:1-deoxy-D-xylulose-5-phosphate reductoisomerase